MSVKYNAKSYISIYYENQFYNNYKIEEKNIKNIVQNYIKCIDKNNKVRLIVYFKNEKTNFLIMRNNNTPRP